MDDKRVWKLGIIGWPLGYSLSPVMHTAALKAAGLEGEYKEHPVKPEDLDRWLTEVAPTLDGFNVTMPHKEAVSDWLVSQGRVDPFVKFVGALNAVAVRDGGLSGHNTDAEGFWIPLAKRKPGLSEWQILLLGAGGAARAIAATLTLRGAARHIAVWSRTFESAERMAGEAREARGNESKFSQPVRDLVAFPVEQCEMVVNATPMGMTGEGDVPWAISSRLHRRQVVYDIVYEPKETRLVLMARKAGCTVITGDEMLAAQGAASFEIWTGVKAAKVLPVMQQALDEHFAGRD